MPETVNKPSNVLNMSQNSVIPDAKMSYKHNSHDHV